jgi:hypothetical protein
LRIISPIRLSSWIIGLEEETHDLDRTLPCLAQLRHQVS